MTAVAVTNNIIMVYVLVEATTLASALLEPTTGNRNHLKLDTSTSCCAPSASRSVCWVA